MSNLYQVKVICFGDSTEQLIGSPAHQRKADKIAQGLRRQIDGVKYYVACELIGLKDQDNG